MRTLVGSLAALAIALALGVYLLAPGDAPPVGAAPAPAVASTPTPTPAAAVESGAISPASGGAPSVALAPDETVLCGHGRMKFDAATQVRDRASETADKVFDGVKTALAASKKSRDVALALYLRQSIDALVAMASGQGDPQIYALAFMACGYGNAGNCALLSAQQWAALEPDNGMAWLLAASAAGNDLGARNSAVERASTARTFDPHTPDFLAMLQWPALRDQPPQVRSAIQNQLTGLQTTLPTPLFTPFLQYCSDPSMEATARASVCARLSNTLLHDRSLLAFSTGIRLAELSGAPREQVQAWRQKKGAFQVALNNSALTRIQERPAMDCEDIAAFDRWAADYSRLGETGLAAKLVDEAGVRTDAAKGTR